MLSIFVPRRGALTCLLTGLRSYKGSWTAVWPRFPRAWRPSGRGWPRVGKRGAEGRCVGQRAGAGAGARGHQALAAGLSNGGPSEYLAFGTFTASNARSTSRQRQLGMPFPTASKGDE